MPPEDRLNGVREWVGARTHWRESQFSKALRAFSRKGDAKAVAHRRGSRKPWLIGACLAGLVLVVASVIAIQSAHSGSPRETAGAALRPRAIALSVESVSPLSGATNVSFTAAIDIQFSTPLANNWAAPVLSPPVPGTWIELDPSTLSFEPAGNYVPYSTLHVTIGSGGMIAADGTALDAAFTTSFTVEGASTLRLQELLAELNYLPVTFVPPGGGVTSATVPSPAPTSATSTTSTALSASPTQASTASTTPASTTASTVMTSTSALDDEPTVASQISLTSLPGSFPWRFSDTPAQLSALWQPGTFNVVTEGAIMAFQSEHSLTIDGEVGSSLWASLLSAVALRDVTSRPYNYVIATETLPESLFVWSDGMVASESLANTGVAGEPTPLGTWPVYLKFTSTTMSGTNPDGTKYSDPGVPWVSYFNGNDAVHGFVRASYGFQQSDGCIELPIANAAVVFPMDPYGTLVTVTTGDIASELNVPTPSPLS